MIDTHAHLNFNAYKEDAEDVVRRSLNNDVWMINVGSQYSTSKRAVEMAERHKEGVYAAVGLHPIHLADGISKTKLDESESVIPIENEEFYHDKYKDLAKSPKVVAIGECGLDYYYRPKTETRLRQFKERQKVAFLRQLDLGKELDLPMIVHCRSAHSDLIALLRQYGKPLKGVVHCFTGNWQEAQQYLEMGFHLGLNGIIFKLDMAEVIEKIPLDKVLLETDCPYLTPPPESGRNEPLFAKYVAEKIAQIRSLSYEEILEKTTKNAKELFRI